MSKNFCVIDIGTNTVKCKSLVNDKYHTPKNKYFSKSLNIDEVSKYISEFIENAKNQNIPLNRIYIAATEGLRKSPNAKEIIDKIKEETGRQVHIISPEREALLAIIGGLKPLKFKKPYPKQILFIESGGGSTEVSLVNSSKKPISIEVTTSIPLGTKKFLIDDDIDKTEQLITDKILELVNKIKSKGIAIDPSLEIVINSPTASKIIGKPHGLLNPKAIMQQNIQMNLEDFLTSLAQSCDKDVEKEYNVHHLKITGFKAHRYILGSLLTDLKDYEVLTNPSIRTTIEGLKEGLASEIKRNIDRGKTDDEIEDNILKIQDDNTTNKTNTPNKNNEPDKITKPTNLINKITHKEWTKDCEQFYNSRHKSYVLKQDTKDNLISIQDKNNKLTYITPKEVIVTIDKQCTNNRLYEDMVVKAKKDGITSIRFKPDTCFETKLRIYAACQKHNMPVRNFIYNPDMLQRTSPQTKQIVEFSTQSRAQSRERN